VNAVRWLGRPAATLEAARARYGDVWTLRLLAGNNFVFVSDPDLIEPVLNADPEVLLGGAAHQRVATALLGEGSLLLLDEPEHSELKDLIMPPFNADHVQQYRAGMTRVVEREVETWPLNEPISMLPRMQWIALNVIMTTAFGGTEGEELETLRSRIQDLLDVSESPLRMGRVHLAHSRNKGYPKVFVRVRDAANEAIYTVLESIRNDPRLEERADVLSMLIRARRKDGSPLSDSQLRDQIITFMIQGHASTATALSWTIERVTRHPQVVERLREEALGNGPGEYTAAVIKESLRARPPLPIAGARLVSRPYRLGEYELPAGTMVAVCIYLLHRDPRLYPEPDRFRPERFLDGEPGRYEWIPFGGGPRHCIGASFALTQMEIVLSTIVARTRLAPTEQADEKIRRRGVGLSPRHGGRVIVQERFPAVETTKVTA
jgi:cytochrome P450